MSEEFIDIPALKGYVSIKEAAKMLGVSSTTVYEYVQEGRIPAERAANVLMLPVEAVKNFKPNISGRPRKSVPVWRISPEDNTLWITSILVSVRAGKREIFMKRLETIRRKKMHKFPGTVARYIAESQNSPGQVEVILVWRSSVMPDEELREEALEEFRQQLADVLDWDTAQYRYSRIIMHA